MAPSGTKPRRILGSSRRAQPVFAAMRIQYGRVAEGVSLSREQMKAETLVTATVDLRAKTDTHVADRRGKARSSRALAGGILLVVILLSLRFGGSLQETVHLLEAQSMTAALFRDVIASVVGRPSSSDLDQVVFFENAHILRVYLGTNRGWQEVRSSQAPLTLPDRIVVLSWTFPTNAMRAWGGGGRIKAWPGLITLAGPNGLRANVQVEEDGRVWYIPVPFQWAARGTK